MILKVGRRCGSESSIPASGFQMPSAQPLWAQASAIQNVPGLHAPHCCAPFSPISFGSPPRAHSKTGRDPDNRTKLKKWPRVPTIGRDVGDHGAEARFKRCPASMVPGASHGAGAAAYAGYTAGHLLYIAPQSASDQNNGDVGVGRIGPEFGCVRPNFAQFRLKFNQIWAVSTGVGRTSGSSSCSYCVLLVDRSSIEAIHLHRVLVNKHGDFRYVI